MQVWKYRDTQKLVDGALEQIYACVQTPEGRTQADLLLAGGINGSLRYRQVNVILNMQDSHDYEYDFLKINYCSLGYHPMFDFFKT